MSAYDHSIAALSRISPGDTHQGGAPLVTATSIPASLLPQPASADGGAKERFVVAMGAAPSNGADVVRQRFIDTMNSAQALDRGASTPASTADQTAAAGAAEADGPDRKVGGISALFGKISAMHADLDRRVVDPASYTSAASMMGLQRMTGMYSIYFETLSKAVFKVVRDADTFMKSSA